MKPEKIVLFLISCLAVAKIFSVLSLVQYKGVSLLKRRRHFLKLFYEHIKPFIVIVYVSFIVLCIYIYIYIHIYIYIYIYIMFCKYIVIVYVEFTKK